MMKRKSWIWIGAAAAVLAALIALLYYTETPRTQTEGYLVRGECGFGGEQTGARRSAEYVTEYNPVY